MQYEVSDTNVHATGGHTFALQHVLGLHAHCESRSTAHQLDMVQHYVSSA